MFHPSYFHSNFQDQQNYFHSNHFKLVGVDCPSHSPTFFPKGYLLNLSLTVFHHLKMLEFGALPFHSLVPRSQAGQAISFLGGENNGEKK
jgi:hypothetical protein